MACGYYKSKRVHVFLNGCPNSKAFYVHPKCRLGWTAILDCFSKKLNPKFGAIRVLRTIDGRKIIESFSDLQNEGKYVACGLGPFQSIRGGYTLNSEVQVNTKTCDEYYPAKNLSPDEKKKYPCLIETMRKGRTIIYVFANGKKGNPKKLVLIKSDYEAWDSILEHIGIMLDIPEGVKGLCTVFGQCLCSQYEIQHGGYYVAIPYSAVFKPMKYLSSQRSKSWYESSPLVTKDVYISAAKTCVDLDGASRKRRNKSTKVRGNSKNSRPGTQEKIENRVKIVGNAISLKKKGEPRRDSSDEGFVKFRCTGYPGSKFFQALAEMNMADDLSDDEDEDDFIDHPQSDDEFLKSGHIQEQKSTQTSTVFFDAKFDENNALSLYNGKYYLVPEKEFKKLSNLDSSQWYSELYSELYQKSNVEFSEEARNEVRPLAGAIVGIIIDVSEKIAQKAMFLKSHSNVGVVSFNEGEKLSDSSSSDEFENKLQHANAKRSVRLSTPYFCPEISEKLQDDSSNDRDFCPLTPSHKMELNLEEMISTEGEDDDMEILKRLKKDSVRLDYEDLIINDEGEEDEEDDEDNKLDILDDFGITREYDENEEYQYEEYEEIKETSENIIFENERHSDIVSLNSKELNDHNNTNEINYAQRNNNHFADDPEEKIEGNPEERNSAESDQRLSNHQSNSDEVDILQPLDDESIHEKVLPDVSEKNKSQSEDLKVVMAESNDEKGRKRSSKWEVPEEKLIVDKHDEETTTPRSSTSRPSSRRSTGVSELEEERRSLIVFLKTKIELELNGNMCDSADASTKSLSSNNSKK